MEMDDLRRLAADVAQAGWQEPVVPEHPHLRRPPRDELGVYRVRVDLDGARPPIWRRLDLRSDLTLDVVHRVLQAAFGWLDYHLHRFSLGGGPFDHHSEIFLCPFDVEEGEDDGVPASEVRLDETLQDPGDVLSYLYDYGDSWELTIRLEEVRPAEASTPAAVCVDGRRAAPPEDCGYLVTAEELAKVLDDPARFDVAEVNLALSAPYFVLREAGFPLRLEDLLYRLEPTSYGDEVTARLLSLAAPTPEPATEEKEAALRAFLWFLDRADGEGFELTRAGYLKPADVEEASQVVPSLRGWVGKNNREAHAYPLLAFRETLRRLGLLRKYKGRLRLTRTGAKMAGDPDALWHYLAGKLVEESRDRFTDEASLLLVAHAATSTDGSLSLEKVAGMLGELGWVRADHHPIDRRDLFYLEPLPLHVLRNVGEPPDGWLMADRIGPAAVALTRAALLPGRPTP